MNTTFMSKIGPIYLEKSEKGLTKLIFIPDDEYSESNQVSDDFRIEIEQLNEYFDGKRHSFDFALDLHVTDFQRRVCEEMLKIPYGETLTYGDIAKSLGKPSASRAVGGAVGSNPIAVVVPCHRVVAGSGALTGFSAYGGIETKRRLLEIEGIRTNERRILR